MVTDELNIRFRDFAHFVGGIGPMRCEMRQHDVQPFANGRQPNRRGRRVPFWDKAAGDNVGRFLRRLIKEIPYDAKVQQTCLEQKTVKRVLPKSPRSEEHTSELQSLR